MQRRNFLKITAGLGVAAFAAACSKQETAPSEQAATSAASSSAAEQHQRVIALNTGGETTVAGLLITLLASLSWACGNITVMRSGASAPERVRNSASSRV